MLKLLKQTDNRLIIFSAGGILTALIFFPLSFLDHKSYLHTFFLNGWWIQVANTYLFWIAIIFILNKYRNLKDEKKVAELIDIKSISVIHPEKVKEWLKRVPSRYRLTIGYRRISELLRSFLNRYEVIALNEELSRRDMDQVERGHLLLNSIRQLIPILGFLGTVVGLSLGMIIFPEHAAKAANVEQLRDTLRAFAASLAVGFNTTLLALGYTVIIIIVSTILREKEESFVSQVDSMARELISRFKSDSFETVPKNGTAERDIVSALERLEEKIGKAVATAASEMLRQNNLELVRRLETMIDALRKPPSYEIVVQPIKGNLHE